MNRPEKKGQLSKRKDFYTAITLAAMAGAFIFRIPLGYLIGEKGLACFGTANEIYIVIAGMISYGLSEAVTVLVRFSVRREQYRNAQKVLRSALFLGGILGFLFTVFFGLLGSFAAERLMHIPVAGLAVSLMAPSMFFIILTGVFRGYFQGNGSRILSIHSKILHLVFLAAGGLTGAAVLRGYGAKVSALLQNEDYTSAYGAMGASFGFLAASVLCFLHAFILYYIYKRSIKRQLSREQPRGLDTSFSIFHMLIGTGAVYSLLWICNNGLPFIDQILFFLFQGKTAEAVGRWGAYYGKCLVLFGIATCVISIICLFPVRRIVGFYERDDRLAANEGLGILIHQCVLIAVPTAIYLAVFSENILDLIFSGDRYGAAAWVKAGSPVVVFAVFATVFMEILIKSRRRKYAAFLGGGALVVHTGVLLILLKTTKIGMNGVIISNILFYFLAALGGFLLISRIFEYRQEWIKSFAITIVVSAISGVIAMLLNKVFAPIVGLALSMLICLLVAVPVYLVLLIVTRAFREGELEEMPGGRLLLMLADLFHYSS